jgi:hypothetical protein
MRRLCCQFARRHRGIAPFARGRLAWALPLLFGIMMIISSGMTAQTSSQMPTATVSAEAPRPCPERKGIITVTVPQAWIDANTKDGTFLITVDPVNPAGGPYALGTSNSAPYSVPAKPGAYEWTVSYQPKNPPPFYTPWVEFTSTVTVPDIIPFGYVQILESFTQASNYVRQYTLDAWLRFGVSDPARQPADVTTAYSVNPVFTWYKNNTLWCTGNGVTLSVSPGQSFDIAVVASVTVCGLNSTYQCSRSIFNPGMYGSTNTGGSFGNTNTGGSYSGTNTGNPYSAPQGMPSPKFGADIEVASDDIMIQVMNGEFARILTGANLEGTAFIAMSDILGRVVLKDQILLGSRRRYDISLTSMNIPAGIYFTRVEGPGIVRTQKVWKR